MRRIGYLLGVAVATLLAAAAVAQAATPVQEWVAIDDTFTWDDCGFAVEEHDEATLHFISWYDPSGARLRQIVAAPGSRITWTNVATGDAVTTVNPYVVHKLDHPDGSATIAFTGLQFVLPGGGRAYVDSGRDVIVFSPGSIELVSSVGPKADLCAALTAAIG